MAERIRSAMVVGGGRGLGRAIAGRLAVDGWRVGVLARNEGEVEDSARSIRAAGGESRGFVADVLDPPGLRRAFDRFDEWAGGGDALVIASGRLRAIGPLETVDAGDWWLDLETTLRGASNAIRALLPTLRKSPRGSIAALVGPGHASSLPFASGYASAQAGLVRLIECLDGELRPEGIHAYAVNPGLVPTSMVRHILDDPEGRRRLPSFTEAFAEGKEVGPEVVAEMVAWLLDVRPAELAGRVVPALATPEILETRLARIESEGQLRLRLR